jgi:hypothetical protein
LFEAARFSCYALARSGRVCAGKAAHSIIRVAAEVPRRGTRAWHGYAATKAAAPKPTIARALYGWFTEGFGIPHLKEAKALFDELA